MHAAAFVHKIARLVQDGCGEVRRSSQTSKLRNPVARADAGAMIILARAVRPFSSRKK
jgi:hypothetical protein